MKRLLDGADGKEIERRGLLRQERTEERSPELHQSPMACNTASLFGGTTVGSNPAALMAVSGSFKPWPVMIATTRLPSGICPSFTQRINPASGVAQAGSTNRPSVRAINLYAARISS